LAEQDKDALALNLTTNVLKYYNLHSYENLRIFTSLFFFYMEREINLIELILELESPGNNLKLVDWPAIQINVLKQMVALCEEEKSNFLSFFFSSC